MNFQVWHWIWMAGAWLVALAWWTRTAEALVRLPEVPRIGSPEFDGGPEGLPSLTVIVPAKNESAGIEAALESLMAAEYAGLQVIAVNDRSTDATGEIMDRIESGNAGRLRVIHVETLPEGWMGKTHAMAVAARDAKSEWLLFTDGDVNFAPDALRRAVSFAEKSAADHVVVYPTLVLRSLGERMMMAFFHVLATITVRPWQVPNPKAKRDFLGVGAFNLIRRNVYKEIGGWASLRMEVVEDMRLGFRVKKEGYRQRVAFGRNMVRVRWAESTLGMVGNLTKNTYSVFRFNPVLLVGACIGIVIGCIGPFAALLLPWMGEPVAVRAAGAAAIAALLALEARSARETELSPLYVLLFPVAASVFIYALLRSMVLTWVRGGVLWRGTLYPTREIRRRTGRLW